MSLRSGLPAAVEVLARSGARPYEVAALGTTNQRETTIVWDRETGTPLYNAITDRTNASRTLLYGIVLVLVPAFTGLGAPHWDPYTGGMMIGLIRDTGIGHIARAALESIAFQVTDRETGMRKAAHARVLVNATGIFTDDTRRLAQPDAAPMVTPSQGIHLVLDRSVLSGESAIMVPRTSDGRVLFAIPWHNRTLAGTTDTPIANPNYEPLPLEEEIEFVLDTARDYLSHPPTRADVLSLFVGILPLIGAPGGGEGKTSALSRGHTIHVDESGLVTIVGGKWTTYRHLAEDCLDHAILLGGLAESPCATEDLKIHGYHAQPQSLGVLGVYCSDAAAIRRIAQERDAFASLLHPDLPYIAAEIVWAVRHEMSRTLEDALARRTRALLLDAQAAIDIAPRAAALMADELGRDSNWIDRQIADFITLVRQYFLGPGSLAAAMECA